MTCNGTTVVPLGEGRLTLNTMHQRLSRARLKVLVLILTVVPAQRYIPNPDDAREQRRR